MEQELLFADDIHEAIRHAVTALGGSKAVGHRLWPDMPPPQAGEKLANCLNPLRPEKLAITEFLLIRREARWIGCHIIAAFENTDAGYAPPQAIEPVDEWAELQRQFIETVKTQKRIGQRLEELVSPVREVRHG